MNNFGNCLALGVVLHCCVTWAQISATEPEKYIVATPLEFGLSFGGLELPHNAPDQIRREVLDPGTLRAIVKLAGLAETDLATIEIAPSRRGESVTIYQIRPPAKAFNAIRELLRTYVHDRKAGHTKAFLLAAATNTVPLLAIPDPDLRVLIMNRSFIPPALVQKVDSGTRTNKGGEFVGVSTTITMINGRLLTNSITNTPAADQVYRWVRFRARDGDIEWIYDLEFGPNGKLDSISDTRRDAKEGDPGFQKIIKEAEDEVDAEMKRNGSFGRFGSVHTHWRLKKEKLKAKGVAWRSPAALNPNARFD